MLAWVYASPADELAAAATGFFPDVPKDILAQSLNRYRKAGLWSRETMMNQQGFTRLGQSLYSGGFIAHLPRYDECVELQLNDVSPGH